MSRIIVKGLPKYITEDRLKEHFGKKGDITDVKLRKNNKGESRRFAFLGFRNQADAEECVKYFNDSFIDTCRIQVELAKSFADPEVPKSFKQKKYEALERVRMKEQRELERQERAKERELKRQKKSKSAIDEEIESNPKLKEFVESMKPASQSKSWSNGVVVNTDGGVANSLLDKALKMKSGEEDAVENKFSNEIADEIFKIPENESDEEYDNFNTDGKPENEEENQDEPMMDLSQLEEKQDSAKDENISDLEWLKQRRIRIKGENLEPSEEAAAERTTSQESKTKSQVQPKEPELSEEERNIKKIKETGRLFVRNILYTATEEDFRQLFEKYGKLEEVHVAVDTRNGTSKGFVYVLFANPDDAVTAYIEQDKQIFQGRLLHILPAEAKKDHRLDEFDLKNLPLKKQKELKKKAEAAKSTFAWNSLYMNNDAIMNSIAADLGLQKSDLIDPENSSSAVKEALAEAHVIGNVRKFFEDKGIDLTKFQGKERDDKVILIKNFPYGTTETEIIELFQPYGELKRLIMPPSGTIAIIEFRDAPSGRSAFTKLSYRRFKKSILYLEKGPKDLFTKEPEEVIGQSKSSTENVKEVAKETVDDLIQDKEEVETFEGVTVSVFVKNLNFLTTSQDLTKIFKNITGFLTATVKTKPDPRDSTQRQSMGFGFAEFKTKEQAENAIKILDNSILDGHKLQLKLSHRQNVVGNGNKKAKLSNGKIIVKNLPFEATRKDVFELFNAFGQIKSVRVPKKFDKSARGFAFVEYVLAKEAEVAMDQLQGVHLLGRRLVLQSAEQDSGNVEDEIDRLTKKVSRQVETQKIGAVRMNGKRKLELEDEENDGLDGN